MSDTDPFAELANTGPLSLDQLMDIHAPATYLVRVQGDSMEGAGIYDGDLMVVSKAVEPVRGRIIIAVVNGEPMVKRLDHSGTMPVLRSENTKYPARHVLEGDEFSVWGVVTHTIHPHNRGAM